MYLVPSPNRFHPLILFLAVWAIAAAGEPQTGHRSPADPVPIGQGLRVRFDALGAWRLETDRGPLMVQCGLRLWTRAGFIRQADARPAAPAFVGPAGHTFQGVLRAGAATVRYWQTATPVPDGLLVQYAISAPDLGPTEEIAAGFDLPVDTFRGAICTLVAPPAATGGPAASEGRTREDRRVTLPDAQSPEPRLIESEIPGIILRRNGQALGLFRCSTGKIIVQDGRPWQTPFFQVMLYATRGVGDPEGWRSITFLLLSGHSLPGGGDARAGGADRLSPPRSGTPGPLLGAVVPGRVRVPCYEFHEAEAHFWAAYDNPFRDGEVRLWAEVTAPSGRQTRVPGFFTRDYERTGDGEAERLSPTGPASWRLRIAPTEPGIHSYVVKVASPAGTCESKTASFEALPAATRGFLHTPQRQTRYLEDARGQPVFLVGHNACWPSAKAPSSSLERAFEQMARHGMNSTRLWLCTWGIHIEGSKPDEYRLDDAWRLDQALATARDRGLYVQLCLDNFTDLTALEKAADNPYLARNGGACQRPDQFFTSPKAAEQYRRRLAYLVARYAPFASLLAWELCNEADCATENRRDPALLAWTRGAAAFLKEADPYHHPVTISLSPRSAWDELWRIPGIDIVESHIYLHRPTQVRDSDELDEAALLLKEIDAGVDSGKPFLVAEFGFLGTSDFNPLNEADKTGVHLHNALWTSALGGCAGTAMLWWWDSYLGAHDLGYHFAAVDKFFQGEALPAAGWTTVRDRGTGPVRVVGMKSGAAALLWIQQRENTWYHRLVERRAPAILPGAGIELGQLGDGRYRIEWWDTYSGELATHTTQTTRDGTLLLRVPPGHPDIACKVRRISD